MEINSGRNEINRFAVSWKEISDTVICQHELVHSQILHNTLYGGYQLLIKDIADERMDDISIKRLQYELFRHSNIVHECVATYCSIKQLNIKQSEAYINTLNEDYLKYYNILSNKIDNCIKGSFIQYLVGFRIATVCLNVDIYNSVMKILNQETYRIEEHMRPNLRLELFLNSTDEFFYKKLSESINRCVRKLKEKGVIPKNFNHHDDNDWSDIDLIMQDFLNENISNVIWDYISRYTTAIEVFDKKKYNKIGGKAIKLMEDLDAAYGIPLISKNSGEFIEIKNLDMNIDDYYMIKYINSSVIDNAVRINYSDKMIPSMISVFNIEKFKELSQSTYIHHKVVFNPENSSEIWHLIKTREKDYAIAGALLNQELLRRQIGVNDLFVVGLYAKSHIHDFLDIDKVIHKFNSEIILNKDIDKLKQIYYMHGDISFWMNYLQSKGKMRAFIMIFNDENATQIDIFKKDNDFKDQQKHFFGAIVLYSDSSSGVFIRVYNRIIFNNVHMILIRLIMNGSIEIDESEVRRSVERNIIQAFKAIESVWPEY